MTDILDDGVSVTEGCGGCLDEAGFPSGNVTLSLDGEGHFHASLSTSLEGAIRGALVLRQVRSLMAIKDEELDSMLEEVLG